MKNSYRIGGIAILFASSLVFGAPSVSLNVSFGPELAAPHAVCRANNGDLLIAGTSLGDADAGSRAFFLRADSLGNRISSVFSSLPGKHVAYAVCQTPDGGFAVAGYVGSGDWGGEDAFLTKIDSLGQTVFFRTYGGGLNDRVFAMTQTPDSGFILAGSMMVSPADTCAAIAKIDKNGNLTAMKTYSASGWAAIHAIQNARGGGYVIAGGMRDRYAAHHFRNSFMAKIDESGGMEEYRLYERSIIYAFDTTSDGGYIAAGCIDGISTTQVVIGKIDAFGNLQWHETLGGFAPAAAGYAIFQTADGGYLCAANAPSPSADSAAVLIKTDAAGNVVWQKAHAGFTAPGGLPLHKVNGGDFLYCHAQPLGYTAAMVLKPNELSLRLDVLPGSPGSVVPNDFVGLSFEASRIGDTVQFNTNNNDLLLLFRQIGPGVIRVGGNSVDLRGGNFLDTVQYRRFFDFVKITGWKLVMGLGLGTYDTAGAAAIAHFTSNTLNDALLSYEVGNAADYFPLNGLRPANWDLADYEAEFEHYMTAVRARVPFAPFSGPAIARTNSTWVTPFARHMASKILLLTTHYYSLGPAGDTGVSIGNLLGARTKARMLVMAKQTVEAARATGCQARFTECNTVYNGGQRGVSDVFGSSLWTADMMFSLAQQGMTGVNFHGGRGGNCYTPILYDSSTGVSPQPEYYGILFFKYGAKGRFVGAGLSDTTQNIGAYALQCNDDSMRVIIINKDSLMDYSIEIKGIPYTGPGSLIRLTAPSLRAKSGLRLGGAPVTASQPWALARLETVAHPSAPNEGYAVTVPAASAAIVTLRRQ